MITIDGIKVTPTMFPDKTSQVWKLPESIFAAQKSEVVWDFEHEGELMHLAQLKELLSLHGNRSRDINSIKMKNVLYLKHVMKKTHLRENRKILREKIK